MRTRRISRLAAPGRLGQRGFTMVELMVTIAIAAILAMLAVPAYNEAMLGSKLNTLSSNFVASVQLARSEAIKRNTPVTLCASSDASTCTGTWTDGWVVLAGGAVIHAEAQMPYGFQLSEATDVTSIVFQPTGVGATASTLTLCRSEPTVGSQKRTIEVSLTGRPNVKKAATSSCS